MPPGIVPVPVVFVVSPLRRMIDGVALIAYIVHGIRGIYALSALIELLPLLRSHGPCRKLLPFDRLNDPVGRLRAFVFQVGQCLVDRNPHKHPAPEPKPYDQACQCIHGLSRWTDANRPESSTRSQFDSLCMDQ